MTVEHSTGMAPRRRASGRHGQAHADEQHPDLRFHRHSFRFFSSSTGYFTEDEQRLIDPDANDQGQTAALIHHAADLGIDYIDTALVCSVLTAVTSHAQLEANVGAAEWELAPEHVQAVQELVPG